MYRRKVLAVAVSVAALAATAAPAGAAPVRPEPHGDHIIAILIGQVQAPAPSPGFMDYTDDV
jgi:hypothetical protein